MVTQLQASLDGAPWITTCKHCRSSCLVGGEDHLKPTSHLLIGRGNDSSIMDGRFTLRSFGRLIVLQASLASMETSLSRPFVGI
ncbi:hypothetical protein O9929_05535 [Vibrio lentus]|nr:hypothetical protein [Vibrio lentus]